MAGSSPIQVLWLKDGEPLADGGEYSMLYDDNTAMLQISCGEARHSAEYTCVATNSVGSASCRAKLTLQGRYLWQIFYLLHVRSKTSVLKLSLLLLLYLLECIMDVWKSLRNPLSLAPDRTCPPHVTDVLCLLHQLRRTKIPTSL